MFDRPADDMDNLLHASAYTPEQLSELTGVGVDVIRRAAFDGEIGANIVNSDIIDIPRDSAVRWLNARSEIVAEETP